MFLKWTKIKESDSESVRKREKKKNKEIDTIRVLQRFENIRKKEQCVINLYRTKKNVMI